MSSCLFRTLPWIQLHDTYLDWDDKPSYVAFLITIINASELINLTSIIRRRALRDLQILLS